MCFGNDRPKTLPSEHLALMLQFHFTEKKAILVTPCHQLSLSLKLERTVSFSSSYLGLWIRTCPVGLDLIQFPAWGPHLQGKVVGYPHGVSEVGTLRQTGLRSKMFPVAVSMPRGFDPTVRGGPSRSKEVSLHLLVQ